MTLISPLRPASGATPPSAARTTRHGRTASSAGLPRTERFRTTPSVSDAVSRRCRQWAGAWLGAPTVRATSTPDGRSSAVRIAPATKMLPDTVNAVV